MKKIPSLFQRDWHGDRLARDEVSPGCEWVLNGEGVAFQKWDGTCCLIREGKLYKRREIKGDKQISDFLEVDYDPTTNKHFGWVPVGDGPEDRWHNEALNNFFHNYPETTILPDWTYELVGPKVQGNPHGLNNHVLLCHTAYSVSECHLAPHRTFDDIRTLFTDPSFQAEGIVWWRDPEDLNCDKVKIKVKDFGLPFPKES